MLLIIIGSSQLCSLLSYLLLHPNARAAISLDEDLGNTPPASWAGLAALASARIAQGDYADALAHAKRALVLHTSQALTAVQAHLLSVLSLTQLRTDNLATANAQIQAAIRMPRACWATATPSCI